MPDPASLKIPLSLHKQLKVKASESGAKLNEYATNLLQSAISADHGDAGAHHREPTSGTQTLSADESAWIQKVLDLLRSTEYGEAAKHEIGALHGAMMIDKALARVEEFAREAETDPEAGVGERGAKALEIIRAVKDSIKAARHAVRTRSDNTRGRRGNHGHSG